MADHLTKNGFETRIIHTGLEEHLLGRWDVREYLRQDLLIAGCSAHWLANAAESLDLLKEIKQANPKIFTVLGGYTASFFARQIVEDYPWVDGVVRGDGERPLLELTSRLRNGTRDLHEVPNLLWRSNGKAIENPFSYVSTPADLEHIEFANFRRYLHNYARGQEYYAQACSLSGDLLSLEAPVANNFFLLTGKGCVHDCLICGGGRKAQQLINNRRQCMFLSPAQVVRTVRQAIGHGYKSFYICFDPKPSQPQYLEYLRAIRDEGLDVNLCFGFWRLPTQEIVHEFKRTAKHLLFEISPESISERVRRVVKRTTYYSNKELNDTVDMLYKERVYCHVYFAYFLPTETISDLRETRKAFWGINLKYPHYIEAMYIKISTDPGAPLYLNPDHYDVRLLVGSLQDHLRQSREVPYGNIMVHDILSVPREEQERFHRQIELDTLLKNTLKYHIKYVGRAFPSVEDFVEFLDGFYNSSKLLNEQETAFLNRRELLSQLRSYAQLCLTHHPSIGRHLVDVVKYVEHLYQAIEANLEAPCWNLPDLTSFDSTVIALSGHAALAELEYDVHRAVTHLMQQKEFSDIQKRTNTLLFVKGMQGVELFEVNDSLFEILLQCKGNQTKSGRDILRQVIELYTDDEQTASQIERDMWKAIDKLGQGGVLRCVQVLNQQSAA